MSELAFNVNGESFEVPEAVTGWRVRLHQSTPFVIHHRPPFATRHRP